MTKEELDKLITILEAEIPAICEKLVDLNSKYNVLSEEIRNITDERKKEGKLGGMWGEYFEKLRKFIGPQQILQDGIRSNIYEEERKLATYKFALQTALNVNQNGSGKVLIYALNVLYKVKRKLLSR